MSPFAAVAIVLVLAGWGLFGLVKRAQAAPGKPSGGVLEPIPVLVVGPAAKCPYAGLINRFAEKYGQDPDLIAAIVKVESGFDPNAENPEDPGLDYDSSYGLMQVQLAVAQDFGKVEDYHHATVAEIAWLKVPENNINCGAWNVDRWIDKYGLDIALHMENVGEHGFNVHGSRNWPHVNKIKAAYDEYQNAS